MPAAIEGVRGVLLRLRTHAGLTVERLHVTEVDVSLLADLPSVRRLTATGLPAEPAIVRAISGMVGQLDATELLVADAALALGVARAVVGDHPAFADVYADELGSRRTALIRHWSTLHTLLGVDPPPSTTVRSLRGTIEARVLGQVAALSVTADLVPEARSGRSPRGDQGNPVVIVGGAVIDQIFLVDHIPTTNTSAPAASYDSHPGGKGLNLAVAGKRMDLDTRLISAVGDDGSADRILDYLRSEHLPTDLIKRTPGVRTPVTCMFVTETGDTVAVGWKNESDVGRTTADLRALSPVLSEAAAVLVTFEPSLDEVQWALATAARLDTTPLLLVQPSPPMDAPQKLYRYLSTVDYLVGSEWELRELLPLLGKDVPFEEVQDQLLRLGVKAVCAVEELACRIRTKDFDETVRAPNIPLNETPGAREAFSAALVYQLLAHGRHLTVEKLKWPAAAMAAKISLDDIPESMPERKDIQQLIDQGTGV